MKKWIIILSISGCLLAGCDLLGSDDNDLVPFEAGPILFIYNGQLWSMEEDGSDVK